MKLLCGIILFTMFGRLSWPIRLTVLLDLCFERCARKWHGGSWDFTASHERLAGLKEVMVAIVAVSSDWL